MIFVTEIPHDEALPQLATALDTAAMRSRWQTALFGQTNNHFQVSDCSIERIKYKPGNNCLILYHLDVEDKKTTATSQQRLTGRIYEAGGSTSRFRRAQMEHLNHHHHDRPLAGPPLLHLPDLELVAWLYPHDRKLDSLPELADVDCLRDDLLPPLVAKVFGPDWQISALNPELAHYNPEHSCMIRVSLQLRRRQTGERQQCVLYGKTYYDQEGAQTYYQMRQLWQSKIALQIAQPLLYDARRRILWQMGLSGRTLLNDTLDDPEFLKWLGQAGAAVAALHQTSPVFSHSGHSANGRAVDWLADLQTMRRLLPQVRPACQQDVETVVARLLEQVHHLNTRPVAILHGDLHLDNFLITDDQIALIDLDSLHPGSPWKDLGSFIAGMLYRGLLLEVPDTITHQAIAAFLDGYRQHVPWPLPIAELNWYIAAALINERAFRCVTRLKDGRLDLVDQLIGLALATSTDLENLKELNTICKR